MKVDIASVNGAEKRVTVSLPSELVDRKIDSVYLDLRKNVRLKGFRPGKAPVSILERYFKSQVEEDVISGLVKDTYPKALEEVNASPVSQPKIENSVLERGKDFSYTAVFEIKPEIAVKDYTGIDLNRDIANEATDADVEKEIAALQNNFATMKDVEDRACKKGDYVVIDFDGTVDGKPYTGNSQKNFFLEIAGDSFLPGFEEHITGLEKGMEKTFALAIPEDFPNRELAGKTIKFNVLLKGIKEKILPEVDDEFAKDLGNYTGLEDLKVKIKESIAERKIRDSEAKIKEQIFDVLIDKNPFDVPKSMIETQVRNMIMNTQQMLEARGLKLEDMGQSQEQLFEQYRKPAERQVRSALLLEAIAEAEGITTQEDDLEKKYRELAEQMHQDVNSVKAKITREMLQPQILEQKAIELIISQAHITEI